MVNIPDKEYQELQARLKELEAGITDRKKAEEELAEKKEELDLIASSSLDILFTLTKTGTLGFVSFASKDMLGYEPQEMVGTKFTKYIAKEEWSKCWKVIEEVFLHGQVLSFETAAIDRQGNHVPIEINGQLVKTKTGLVAQGSMRDITDRKKSELEIEKHRDHLEELVKEKTKQLNEKVIELERYRDATIDRELRMKELRDKIAELEKAGKRS